MLLSPSVKFVNSNFFKNVVLLIFNSRMATMLKVRWDFPNSTAHEKRELCFICQSKLHLKAPVFCEGGLTCLE